MRHNLGTFLEKFREITENLIRIISLRVDSLMRKLSNTKQGGQPQDSDFPSLTFGTVSHRSTSSMPGNDMDFTQSESEEVKGRQGRASDT